MSKKFIIFKKRKKEATLVKNIFLKNKINTILIILKKDRKKKTRPKIKPK